MISCLCHGAHILAQLLGLHDFFLMWRSSITLAPWHLTYVTELIFLLNYFGPWHFAYVMEFNSYSINLAPWHLAYVKKLTFLLNYFSSMASYLCDRAHFLSQSLWLHDILLMSRSSILICSIILAPWHLVCVIELTFLLNYFGCRTFCLCHGAQFIFAQLFWLHDILLMSWNSLSCSITLAAGHFAYVMELNCLLNYFGCTTSCLFHGSQFFWLQNILFMSWSSIHICSIILAPWHLVCVIKLFFLLNYFGPWHPS